VLRFEWNALRIGHKVLLHDWASADFTLTPGVVASVDTQKGLNRVGIRLPASNGERMILWPSSHAVHRDPLDLAEPCWQCQELAESTGQAQRRPDVAAQTPVGARADPPPPQPVLSTPGVRAG
jgi:hypothetical protein